ncbi:MAG: ABC transporter ATP-binding protein [Deltaproteobacteria bacterium]|nr:ABC transporter ATP-binding protein [Deltaproteobacteria bacterium]
MKTDTSTPAIRLAGIHKSFITAGKSLVVLGNIDLSVATGTIVALLGASGSGKSTLLNLISGLIQTDRGEIRLQGAAGSEFNDWRRISYMFQEDRLLPWRSTLANIEFALEAGSMAKAERRQRAREVLQLVNLGDFEKAFPYQLSGGMRSRVALARSLVTRPTILLMDEPFSRLDAQTRGQIHAELLRIHQVTPLTILFVTHDVEEAVVLADQVAVVSPRPATIRAIVDIDLTRPRDPTHAEATRYIQQLRELI